MNILTTIFWQLTLIMVDLSMTESMSIMNTSDRGSMASFTVLFFMSSAPCRQNQCSAVWVICPWFTFLKCPACICYGTHEELHVLPTRDWCWQRILGRWCRFKSHWWLLHFFNLLFCKIWIFKDKFSLDNQHGYPIFSLVVSFHYYLTDMSDVYV